jgi:hypothetical protein
MPTNEELLGLLNEDQLKFNIGRKRARIATHEKEIDVLRSSSNSSHPLTVQRIICLAELIEDDEEAISNWQRLLDALPVG